MSNRSATLTRTARLAPHAAASTVLTRADSGPPEMDPVDSAKQAGLRYVADDSPGITRRKAGKAFKCVSPDGKPVKDADTLARIKSLAIPPAWTDVWICPDPRGHIQAVGRDQKGRKQYRYHPRWREVRDETKIGRASWRGRVEAERRRAVVKA